MKRYLILLFLTFYSVFSYSQKDVTKFLGIPVDGSEYDMRSKLIEKGYSYDSITNRLSGAFNGEDVYIYIVTNKVMNQENKVRRIMVAYQNIVDEISIKRKFNNLCYQFNENPKYIAATPRDYIIPKNENIEHQISLYKKSYEAAYYQILDSSNVENQQRITESLQAKYTPETLANPTKKQQKDILDRVLTITFDITSRKSVWFTISRYDYNQYGISLYYDNEYNNTNNGSDL